MGKGGNRDTIHSNTVTLTKFQEVVQRHLLRADGSGSLLLVAPTGIGKTLAVTADLASGRKRIIYGVPLRALAGSILDEVSGLKRSGKPVEAVIHHGNVQDSRLFSEEVVVTTYDQIVCAVPGLPLSLPLSAGHAVAGALLMSRLVLDEVHLAWGISPEALTILLGILEFRQRLGLQTVVMTATMPESAAKLIADRMKMKLIVAGDDETKEDEALAKRKENRHVVVSRMEVKGQKAGENDVDLAEVINALRERKGKRIYFANTVDRLQRTHDLLEKSGFDMDQVIVLHNRMPGSWRTEAETLVRQQFGKDGPDNNWVLLTNQVAEAGLDISAPFVLSDPAPVDTLIQRAGRCARWFRHGRTDGIFRIIQPPKSKLKDWALPYRDSSVQLALDKLEETVLRTALSVTMDWEAEKKWIDAAWLGYEEGKKRNEQLEKHLERTTFALNLFDRASQQQSPGVIASTFREILSVQVAVVDGNENADADLLAKLKTGHDLDASSVSLKRGYGLTGKAKGKARVVRYRDELVIENSPSYLVSGDLLLVPTSVAYLHRRKGLCFDTPQTYGPILTSEPRPKSQRQKDRGTNANPQSLWKHTLGVMKRVEERLLSEGDYRSALVKILRCLEGPDRAEELAGVIGRLAILATGFHDLGKCGRRWQQRAHEIDPDSAEELIGRTANTAKRMGIPHTPPGFYAAVAACNAALGNLKETDHLVRSIALAAARHHSSLLDPSAVRNYQFDPVEAASAFVNQVLAQVGLLKEIDAVNVLDAARSRGTAAQVPLMLPNDDLFPIYALVGRAILISDREDAAGMPLEEWSHRA
jgi:CRISPR-associated endonuclease/helicase Cas3